MRKWIDVESEGKKRAKGDKSWDLLAGNLEVMFTHRGNRGGTVQGDLRK